MSAVMFDTLKLSQALKASFTPEQAETFASAIAANAQDNIATKGDLTELKVDLVKWTVTAIAFNFVATAGLFMTFSKFFAR